MATLLKMLVVACGVSLLLEAAVARAADAPAPVSFSKEVAPILVKHCQACHGPPEPKGGYQVVTFTLATKPGESESPAVTPGKPQESEVYNLISQSDADLRMPKEAEALSASQIETIRRWIAEGAKYDAPDANAPLASIVPKLAQPDPPAAYRRPVPVTALAFNHDGSELAAGGYHEVTIWNATSGALLRRIKNVPERVYAIDYSPDGKLLAVAGGAPGQAGEVKLFNPADGALVRELATTADVAFCAAFNPAGNRLATSGADRAIRIFDIADGKQLVLIEDHADWVVGLGWSPDGARLVSASRDKTSKLFNAENGESISTYSGHGEPVFGAAFAGDGKLIFTAGGDKKIHAWNPDDAAKKGEIAGFSGAVLSLTTDADKVFSVAADKSVRQHRLEGFKEFKTYPGMSDAVYAVAYHPGAQRLAASGFAGDVRVWSAEDGAAVASFIAAPGYSGQPVAAK